MAEIDNLKISINADTSKAIKSLDNLKSSIEKLDDALGGINSSKVDQLQKSVTAISDSIASLNGLDTAGLGKIKRALGNLADNIGKFNTADFSKVNEAFSTLKRGLYQLSSSGESATALSKVANGINTLGKVNGAVIATNVITIKDSLGTLASGIEKLSGSSENADVLSSVARSINKIGGDGAKMSANTISKFGREIPVFVRNLTTLQGTEESVGSLTSIANGISRIGGDKAQTAISSLPKLTSELENLINTLNKSPQAVQNTTQLINAISSLKSSSANVSGALGNTSIPVKKFNVSFGTVLGSIGKTVLGVKGFLSIIGGAKFGNSLTQSASKVTSLVFSYRRLQIIVNEVGQAIKKVMKTSMDFIETYNYFTQSMKQVAGNAGEEFATSYITQAKTTFAKLSGYVIDDKTQRAIRNLGEANFGLDPSTTLQYQSQFAQLASSMGVASDDAMRLSEALTKIGGDLASVRNLDFKETWGNLSSGLVGMSRAVDKFGVNIRANAMDQKLAELGISATSASLSQADKALLRTIITLDSAKYSWGDLARTIEQPANQLRLLEGNITSVGRSIGNIFLPYIAKILPYLNAFAIALQKVAENIVTLLGVGDFEWGGSAVGSSDIVSDALDSVGESADEASKKVKAYQNQILGFDEINKLSENKNNDSGSDKGGGLASGLLSGALQDALERYNAEWEKQFNAMSNKANDVAMRITNMYDEAMQLVARKNWESLGNMIASAINKGLEKINVSTVKVPLTVDSFMEGLMETLNSTVDNLNAVELAKLSTNIVKTVSSFFYNAFVEFDYTSLGNKIGETLTLVIKNVDFEKIGQSVAGFFTRLPKTIFGIAEEVNWTELGHSIADFIKGIDIEVDFVSLLKGVADLTNDVTKAIRTALDDVDWNSMFFEVVTAVNTFFSTVKFGDIVGSLTKFASIIIDGVSTVISNLDVAQLDKAVMDMVKGVEWGELIVSAMKLVGTTIMLPFKFVLDKEKIFYGDDNNIEEFKESIKEKVGVFENDAFSISVKFDFLENTFDTWTTLSEKTDKTATDLERIEECEGILRENIPNFDTILHNNSLNWDGVKDSIHDALVEQENYYLLLASEDVLKGFYTDLTNVKLEAEGFKDKITELNKTPLKPVIERDENGNWGDIPTFTMSLEELGNKIRENNYSTDNLTEAEKNLYIANKKEVDAYKEVLKKLDANKKKQDAVYESIENVKKITNDCITETDNFKKESEITWEEVQRQTHNTVKNMDGTFKMFEQDIIPTAKKTADNYGGTMSDTIMGHATVLQGKQLKVFDDIATQSSAKGTTTGNNYGTNFNTSSTLKLDTFKQNQINRLDSLATTATTKGTNGGTNYATSFNNATTPKLDAFKQNQLNRLDSLNSSSASKGTSGGNNFGSAFSTAGNSKLVVFKDGILSLFENAKSSFKTKGTTLSTNFVDGFKSKNISVQGSLDVLDDALSSFSSYGTSAGDNFASSFNTAVGDMSLPSLTTESNVETEKKQVNGKTYDVAKVTLKFKPVQAYATGGFPEEDGMFVANHNELVGKFANGKTAVANNQQITDGIRQAVVEGMMNVFSNVGGMGNQTNEVIFKVDSETLYKAVLKGQQSYDGRYHTVATI